jgi:Flp pilus assembly pilin Flp
MATLFLQFIVILIGICVVVIMLVEPRFEGRNIGADMVTIYFKDPFLAYLYLSSIPVFIGLYKIFKIFEYIRKERVFSLMTIKSLQSIKYSFTIFAVMIILFDAYLAIFMREKDDPTGAIVLGIIIVLISLTIAVTSDVFMNILNKLFKHIDKSLLDSNNVNKRI